MNQPSDRRPETLPTLDRPRLFEDVRIRLSAITKSLSDFNMDAVQLRTTMHELDAVVHRIEWLADVHTCPPLAPHKTP
jgi:hypothetical protein